MCSRILKPTFSFRKSAVGSKPLIFQDFGHFQCTYSACLSVMFSTTACTGASQAGSRPA